MAHRARASHHLGRRRLARANLPRFRGAGAENGPRSRARLLLAFVIWASAPAAFADGSRITIGFLTQARAPAIPVSPLDREVRDKGVVGARLGLADNNTTGRFTGQVFELVERAVD